MSELRDRVIDTVVSIPAGRVMTYAGIAHPDAAHDARARFVEEATPLVDDSDNVRVDMARGLWTPHD